MTTKKKSSIPKKEPAGEKKAESKPKAKKKATVAGAAESTKVKKSPSTTLGLRDKKKKTAAAKVVEPAVEPTAAMSAVQVPPIIQKSAVIQPKPVTPVPPKAPVVEKPKETPKPNVTPTPPVALKSPEPLVAQPARPVAVADKKTIQFNEMMTVKDLAEAMNIKVAELIKKLLVLGTPASINQRISAETASLAAESLGFEIQVKSIYVDEPTVKDVEDTSKLKPRPPVVTVMGHVDHGKTSLLDVIRSTSVAEKEAGGITQHIGAYQVKTARGVITFLDTPGHEAFTAMRARGAMVTDIVILVVAADDSVMPQTIEAIDHAKAASVPIVVAINKVDLPGANVNRVKQELSQHELLAEDWGGKTVMVEVSAKTKHNIDKLLEMVLLESELLDLKANPDKPAKGVVLEAKLDPKRGMTATALVQTGTLKIGDVVVCGLGFGRIKAMVDDKRNNLKEAPPATPVEILGLNKLPQAGDQFVVVGADREAREIAERRQQHFRESAQSQRGHISLENIHTQIEEGKIKDLAIILKTDVQGSLQAIQDTLGKISSPSVNLRFVHLGVGNINESDVLLAEASNAIVFGFNVKVETSADVEAKRSGVDIRIYQIIYEMLADIRAAMEGLLKPEEREAVKGKAEVRQVFQASKVGQAAGCLITEGKLTRGQKARVTREKQELYKGTLTTLRRFKDDVKEVEKGFECGVAIEGFKDFKVGDIIEVFVIEKHSRRLED